MGIEQIIENVKKLKIIALGGNERAFVDDALNAIRAIVPADMLELNHHRYLAKEDELSGLTTSLMSLPFLSEYRLVEIHDAEKLTSADTALLTDYLAKPCTSSLLVLVFNKIDKRSKFIKALDDAKLLTVFDAEPTNAISFITKEALALNMRITTSTATFLLTLVGADLLAAKHALAQLAVHAEGRELTIDDIEQIVIDKSEQDVFTLARMIAEGHSAEALIGLHKPGASNDNAIKFLGVLAWQFRTLAHIRHCLDQGMNDWDTRKAVAIFGARYDWMAQIARKRPMSFHIERLTRLLDCDRSLKSLSVRDPFIFIERLLYNIVRS